MVAEQQGLILFAGCCAESIYYMQQLTQFVGTIALNRANGKTVFVAFLDTRKAFDSVWIDGLL